MKKHIQILIGVALTAMLVFGIVSCNSDNRSPVAPSNNELELANYYMSGPSSADLDGKVGVYITQPSSTCGNNGEVVVEFDDDASHVVTIEFTAGWSYTYPPTGDTTGDGLLPDPLLGKGRHYIGTFCSHGEISCVKVDGKEVWCGGSVNETNAKELTKDQAKPQGSASTI